MRFVIASRQVSSRGGSETYLLTVARELTRLGHEVTIHADTGEADLDSSDGIPRSAGSTGLPESVDVIVAQDSIVSFALRSRYPDTPQLFVAHSSVHDLQLPPQVPDHVEAVIVMNDRVEERMRSLAAPPEIVRLRQPVTFDVFEHPRALPERPRRLLSLGNRLAGARRDALQRACERAGVEFVQVGSQAGVVVDPVEAIAASDIVVGYGRCIVEAMMAGRAAFVFDHQGGDGWVTASSYDAIERDGFMGRAGTPVPDDGLAEALAQYDPTMGAINRDLALRHHDAADHARSLVALARSAGARQPDATHATEFARLTRLAWHWESVAIQRQHAIEERDRRLDELGVLQDRSEELEETRRTLDEARRQCADREARISALESELSSMRRDREELERSGSYRLARRLSRLVPGRGGRARAD